MENATKALVMAGGVLLAVMVVATLLYAATYWGIFTVSDDNAAAVAQLSKFNKEYESYAREALYGTDLISALNKAMDYNYKNNISTTDDKDFINVDFTLLRDVEKKITKYNVKSDGTVDEVETKYVGVLRANKTYSLKTDGDFIEEYLNSSYGEKRKIKKSIGSDGEIYEQYEETIPEWTDFKTRIFKCEISYNDETGKVNLLSFKEQDIDEYTEIQHEIDEDLE